MSESNSTRQVDIFDERDLYLQVKELIVDHIHRKNYQPHSRFLSNRQFAKIVNVSAPTVRQAVVSLVNEGVLYTRRGMGTFVHKVPGKADFKPQKTGLYACLIPAIHSNTVSATVYAIDDLIFADSQRHMLLMNSQSDLEREIQLLDSLLERVVDALIYQPNAQVYLRPVFARAINLRLQKFLAAGVPVILLDRLPEPGYDTIVPDEKESCRLAVKHLLDMDHSRILFVAHPETFQPKIKAFKQVCKDFGLTDKQVRFVMVEGLDPITDTAETLSRVYDECCPFTAIIAASDHYAMGCYDFLKSNGIKCPDDVSLVGADNLEFMENLDLSLTTVWSEPSAVAKEVYKQLEYRMQNGNLQKDVPKEIEVSPKLIIRKSTGRPSLKFGASS